MRKELGDAFFEKVSKSDETLENVFHPKNLGSEVGHTPKSD